MDEEIAALITRLRAHPVYEAVSTVTALRTFMERHVVCVWDFMSLVKSLHRDIVGWTLPWVPRSARTSRRSRSAVVSRARAAQEPPASGLRRTSRLAGTICSAGLGESAIGSRSVLPQ